MNKMSVLKITRELLHCLNEKNFSNIGECQIKYFNIIKQMVEEKNEEIKRQNEEIKRQNEEIKKLNTQVAIETAIKEVRECEIERQLIELERMSQQQQLKNSFNPDDIGRQLAEIMQVPLRPRILDSPQSQTRSFGSLPDLEIPSKQGIYTPILREGEDSDSDAELPEILEEMFSTDNPTKKQRTK